MQFKPALSWRQRAICASLAIVATGTALFLSISAAAAPPSPEQGAIAVTNEQRLQATLDEARRPGADFRRWATVASAFGGTRRHRRIGRAS